MLTKNFLALKLQQDAFETICNLNEVNEACRLAWLAGKNYDVGLYVERGMQLTNQLNFLKEELTRNTNAA